MSRHGTDLDPEGFGPVLRGDSRPRRDPPAAQRPADGFGPPMQGRRQSRLLRLARGGPRGPTLLKGLAAILLIAVLVVTGGAGALLVYASLRIDRIAVQGLRPVGGGRMNVLIVGSDSREGLSEEQLQALGTEAVQGRRTDSILLLSVRGGSAAVLSFPRDLNVTRCDGSQGRINAAFTSGGPDCLVQTVTAVSGIPISSYVEVNFAGFMQVVDAVGGVEIYLDQPMVDRAAGVDLPAGCNLLDGRRALGFVRARNVDNDLGRIARQQRFLAELAETIVAPSTLLDIRRLVDAVGAASEAVTADRHLGLWDLARLARAAVGVARGGLATYTVPTVPETIGGAAVLTPTDGAEAVFSRFADGSILDVAPQPQVGLQPGDVHLDVFNGTSQEGFAARGAEFLEARGFSIDEVGNAEPVPHTVVRHAPGMEPAALLAAAQIPGTTLELAPAGASDLALVLGPDADLSAPAPPPPSAPDDTSSAAPPATGAVGAGPVPQTC